MPGAESLEQGAQKCSSFCPSTALLGTGSNDIHSCHYLGHGHPRVSPACSVLNVFGGFLESDQQSHTSGHFLVCLVSLELGVPQ